MLLYSYHPDAGRGLGVDSSMLKARRDVELALYLGFCQAMLACLARERAFRMQSKLCSSTPLGRALQSSSLAEKDGGMTAPDASRG